MSLRDFLLRLMDVGERGSAPALYLRLGHS
jgi:hypothetical protein